MKGEVHEVSNVVIEPKTRRVVFQEDLFTEVQSRIEIISYHAIITQWGKDN